MRVDHLPHPDWLAAEVEIVDASCDAGRNQFGAIALIRTNGRDHRFRLADHGPQRDGITRVSDDQRNVRRRADRIAHRGKLVLAASGHRPFQIVVALVMRGKIFGDEPAGETGCAIDNDVELRRSHVQFLEVIR